MGYLIEFGHNDAMRIPKTIFVAIFVLTASVGVVFGLIASLQDELGFKNGILGLIAAAAFFSAVSRSYSLLLSLTVDLPNR